MRLLFDNNLSPRLVGYLADLFPASSHVALVGLERSSDDMVWEYARDGGFVIVTKDTDFGDLSALRGFPPKVVWIRVGNCPTARITYLLRTRYAEIVAFATDPTGGILILVDD